MGELIPRQPERLVIEPRQSEAARLALEAEYSDGLPRLVSLWLTSYRSEHTRTAYARQFRRWTAFCREVGVHPLEALRPHADAYAAYLGEQARAVGTSRSKGQALTPATIANALSVASSFYAYAISLEATDRNPFIRVERPKIDLDYSPTEGLTQDGTARLIQEAKRLSARAYALVLLLYGLGLRVNEALGADVTDLGYDRGHRTLTITRKGGTKAKVAVPPLVLDALTAYLDGRPDGPLLITSTGARMREPEAWKCLRRLAKRAGLPQAETIHPHVLRHGFITDGLDQGIPLHVIQDAAGHKDPRTTRRYDRARNRLDNHPGYAVTAAMADRLASQVEGL